jgi:hypothetical protein
MSDNRNASLYIAVLLYEARADDASKAPLYQESFVVLHATSEEEARRMALAHAQQQQTSYASADGATIQWSLKHLVDVSPCLEDELKHGAEIYARHFRNYEAYRAFEPMLGGSVD